MKLFMRATVLVSDVLIYFPAVCLFAFLVTRGSSSAASEELPFILIFLLLCHPALILIDHGHFQYNSVMLGFALAAAALLFRDGESDSVLDWRRLAGAVCFCLAIAFKQMALYYSLPIFCFLLGGVRRSAKLTSTAKRHDPWLCFLFY